MVRRSSSSRAVITVTAPNAPLTTTSKALLTGDSDAAFRELIGNLMTMAQQLTALRTYLARCLGVSEPEYRILLAVAQLQGESGVSVAVIARHLKVSGAFVTMIAQRLVRSGHLEKGPSEVDRRKVLLCLTEQGARMIEAFAEEPKAINDELFRDIDHAEFKTLSDLARRLVAGGERALVLSRLRALGHTNPNLDGRLRRNTKLGGGYGKIASRK